MPRNFKPEDEGKQVVTADGDAVGTIAEAAGATARVEPETDLVASLRRRLGWAEDDDRAYELSTRRVRRFDDGEVRLKRTL